MPKRPTPPELTDDEETRVQAQISNDPDNPDAAPEDAARARPASEALDPALFAALTRRGRPKSETRKRLVTLRLSPAVIEGYQAGGPGWQVRMGEVLAAGLGMGGDVAPADEEEPTPKGKRTRLPGARTGKRKVVKRPRKPQQAA